MTLSEFLRSYRKLSTSEEEARIKRLYLLVEFHALDAVWAEEYPTWHALLRTEKLCPAPYFESFKEATSLYRPNVIERIGADAAVALARIEPHLRDLALKHINGFVQTHQMRPKFAQVYAIVRGLRRSVVVQTVRGKGKKATAYVTRH